MSQQISTIFSSLAPRQTRKRPRSSTRGSAGWGKHIMPLFCICHVGNVAALVFTMDIVPIFDDLMDLFLIFLCAMGMDPHHARSSARGSSECRI